MVVGCGKANEEVEGGKGWISGQVSCHVRDPNVQLSGRNCSTHGLTTLVHSMEGTYTTHDNTQPSPLTGRLWHTEASLQFLSEEEVSNPCWYRFNASVFLSVL